MKEGRAGPYPVPAVFWHSYDHPERRPDPDGATALGATVAAFPSWYLHLVCAACGHSAHVSQVALLLDGWAESASLPTCSFYAAPVPAGAVSVCRQRLTAG